MSLNFLFSLQNEHSLTSNRGSDIQTTLFTGSFTWQDPCQEEPRHHQHSLCPTLPHFQYTLDAHLHPSLPPRATLVYSTQLHKCGQPAQSLCMYTCKDKQDTGAKAVNGYLMACSPQSTDTVREIEGWRAITSCLCHLPQPSPLHRSLWRENTPPPGLHHKACQSFFQRWCAVPQWRGAEPQRCHRRTGTFWITDWE